MAGSKCRIAILQICCDSVIGNNLRKGIDLVRTVKKDYPDVQMIFLPECTDYVPQGRTRKNAASQSEERALLQAYQQEAQTLQTWISLGGIHYPACSSRCSDSKSTCHNDDTSKQTMSHFVLEGGTGNIIRKYDKLHLFQLDDQYCESKYITAGDKVIDPCATPAGLLGLALCFDIRFPMLSHMYRHNKGVDVLAYPSSFTKTTGELGHWHVLLRARAIENQCYVVAAAQCGNDTYGHSCVIDPWGKVIAEINSSDKEGYCTTVIDSNLIVDARRRIPMQCRNDVYTCPEIAMKSYAAPKSEIVYTDFLFGDRTTIKAQQIFYESEHSIAFVNIRPVVPNHVLVCCKRKSQYLRDLSNTERRDIFETVNKVVLKVSKKAANIVIQDGPEAGQSVPHLHFHILPRNGTEFLNDNDELYRQLENHDKVDNGIPLRSDDEMYSEALELRKLF
ncbi:hypothetical protein GJ496_010196 [Pomphorhynchus laevis]|nr:hypothetical protein GJ496_006280 [Pomphorhynchus laevis]KAI0980739.1 hypothetical protein GJ496_010196 [Pomphorhynchus laevis]